MVISNEAGWGRAAANVPGVKSSCGSVSLGTLHGAQDRSAYVGWWCGEGIISVLTEQGWAPVCLDKSEPSREEILH